MEAGVVGCPGEDGEGEGGETHSVRVWIGRRVGFCGVMTCVMASGWNVWRALGCEEGELGDCAGAARAAGWRGRPPIMCELL